MAGALSQIPSSSLKPIVGDGIEPEGEKYKNEIEKIRAALDARQANNAQQMLLAISAGMLTPGPTGGFGESIGHAAGNLAKVQQAQEGSVIEDAKMRLQLAQAEREAAQREKAASSFRGIVRGSPLAAGVSTAGAAPASKGPEEIISSQPGVKPGAQPVRTISMEDALSFAAAYPDQKDLAKMLVDAAKYGSDRFKIAMNGTVYDTLTEKYVDLPIPGQRAEEYYVPELEGNLSMTPYEYSQYRKARESGSARQWIKDYMTAEPEPGAEKPSRTMPKTTAQIAAEAAGAKERSTKTASAETDRTQQTIEAGRGASTKIAHYKTMEGFAQQPGVAGLLGYFERPDFLAAGGKFLEDGKLGVPQIREILMNLGAPQDVINNLNVLSSLAAQTSIDFSKNYGKGQGAVSDFERRLYASLGPTIKDPIEAFMMKSKLLTAKAEYERDLSKSLREFKRKTGKEFDDFQDTPEYQKIIDNYQNKAYELAGIKKPSPSTTGPITAESLKSRLGVK